jgi:hypothetical protein
MDSMRPTCTSFESDERLGRLRAAARLSRNRNFQLFENEAGRLTARRHALRLAALAGELRRYARLGSVRLTRLSAEAAAVSPGWPAVGTLVEIEVPSLRFRRQVLLDDVELELLGEDPAVARMLATQELPRRDQLPGPRLQPRRAGDHLAPGTADLSSIPAGSRASRSPSPASPRASGRKG